jgi:hypothetical protein
MSQIDPTVTGYVVVVALNSDLGSGPTYRPIKFNYLKGVMVASVKPKSNSALRTRMTIPAFEVKKISGTPVSLNGDNITADLVFDGNSYEKLPRQLHANGSPERNYGSGQTAHTEAALFQPTSDASTTITGNIRARTLIYQGVGNESFLDSEWVRYNSFSTYDQLALSSTTLYTDTTRPVFTYTYDQVAKLGFSSAYNIRAKIDQVDTNNAPMDKPLIGLIYTSSTDGKKDRAQLMLPYTYCSTWTMKVPVYCGGNCQY